MALSTIDLAGEVDDDGNNIELVLKKISSARKTQGHKHARVLFDGSAPGYSLRLD